MNKNLAKIEYFPIKDITKIANEHAGVVKARVTDKGQDYKGNQFPAYSQGYTEALQRDMKIKRGPRKGQRHKGLEGVGLNTSGTKIAKRQFSLRGLTMGPGFKVRKVEKDSYTLGWDGEAAMVVDAHKDKRNVIDGIPDKEHDWVVNRLMKSIDRQWDKVKDITIKVG